MRTSLLFLLAFPACNEYDILPSDKYQDGVDGEGEPDIEVDPEEIHFGSIPVGTGQAIVETVTVSNEGDEPLQIASIALEDPTAPYSISAVTSVLIPPEGTATFTVTFTPVTALAASTKVLITSNDPDEAVVKVALSGDGVAPVIELNPVAYDFGTMYIGCEEASPLQISNVGNADLVVSELEYVTASNDLLVDPNEAVNGALPWTLAPGDMKEVYVDYTPLDDYADQGFLTVHSNDPFQPEAQAHQTGGGELSGSNLDIFEQPTIGSSDILFIIDNSCSMADEQANLANNFSAFAAGLTLLELDFQIAVITTDNPQFRGDIITNDTSDIEAEFIAQSAAGTSGSGNEMPTEMAYQATQSGADAGPGSDFLRDDSILSMIFVSDEPDSSPMSWADYLAHFESLKTDSDDVVAHAISGDYPTGCGGASFTNNVYELTVATGGLFLSVCATDWSSHLESLVEASAPDLSSFELTAWPVPETIVVAIDGVTVTSGWSYNGADNTVDFEETSVPEGGATIEIEYALFGDCSQ